MMAIPLYQGHDSPDKLQKESTSHKGLWFERFFNKYDNDWAIGDSVKKSWIDGVDGLCGDKRNLQSHALAQSLLCESLQGKKQIFKNNWHFVTGMGNSHPVENGMSWHPTLGVPYLTGASVKGLLRTWMEEWSDLEGKIFYWFGSDDKNPKEQQKQPQAGALIFFDALPIDQVTLACDIMTPHMGKWYSDGGVIDKTAEKSIRGYYPDTLPADWHNPIPIPFLVVKQASLQFSIAPRPHAKVSTEELQEVMQMLTMALEYLGAGAKTASGYGRFEIDSDANTKIANIRKEALRNDMKPEDSFVDKLKDINEKQLAEMFGKNFNKNKMHYEKSNCHWERIIEILIAEKKSIIESWSSADKNTAQDKAYNKLKHYL